MNDNRPAPPEEFPAGQSEAVPDPEWRIDEGRPCRFTVGPGHARCRASSAVALNRHRWMRNRLVDSWWAYCGDHMYGRWVEDGQVMHWIRKAEEDA